jgi:rRNA-processing protein FCF1
MLEGDCKFLVFKQVIDELEAKSHRSESTIFSNQYRAGMTYLKNNENEYKVIMKDDVKSNDETTDDFILRQCNVFKSAGYRIYLATNDTELRRKAKRKDIDTIFVRQKKYLSMD